MAYVQRLKRIFYYLGSKRVPAKTPGAIKREILSPYFYIITIDNGKKVRIPMHGVTNKSVAQVKMQRAIDLATYELTQEANRPKGLLEELLESYKKDFTATGVKDRTVSSQIGKLNSLLKDDLQVIRLSDINISDIQENLNFSLTHSKHHKKKMLSSRTKNTYIMTLINFGDWLKNKRHWEENVFKGLKKFKGPLQKVRRCMTLEEIKSIIEAAKNRKAKSNGKVKGEERALFYSFLFYTLTRCGAALGVLVGQLNFKKTPAEVVLRGDQVKNRKTVTKPLHPHLSQELKTWIEVNKLKPNERLFKLIANNLTQQFNRDLKFAGIEKVLEDGTSLDIHAFKTTAISIMHDAGLPIKVIQHMAEHADAKTTLGNYARPNQTTLNQAPLALPQI